MLYNMNQKERATFQKSKQQDYRSAGNNGPIILFGD